MLLERTAPRTDIECPRDIIRYECAIQTNSEIMLLTWQVSLQEQIPVSVNVTNKATILNDYITAALTEFTRGELIRSILEVTVFPGISTDQIVLTCSNQNVNDSIGVLVNTACE